jgi:hypothetical protein
MKFNLNVEIIGINGKPMTKEVGGKENDTFLNICKSVVSSVHPDDPKNLEHLNKSMKIYEKLEAAVDGEVEFKKESMVWIRDRMQKFQLNNLVIFKFTKLFDEPLTQGQLDEV